MPRATLGSILLLAACAAPYTPLEKWTSFREHRGLRFDGLPAADYLRARSALLVRSALVREVAVHRSVLDVRVDAPPGATVSLGMAVPVSADGYYLTAAHCVSGAPVAPTADGRYVVVRPEADPALSVVVTDGRRARHGRASVVWISAHGDLALIRSGVVPFGTFARRADDVPDGAPVVAGGYASLVGPTEAADPEAYTGPSAGRARGFGPWTEDHRELRHDAPLAGGDSGGPLVTARGELIGVHTRIAGGLFGRGPSIALQPRWDVLEARIEDDRRRF